DIPVSLYGGDGNDHVGGGAGNDLLDGGGGSAVLSGGDGDDVLVGGTGNDKRMGGAGSNTLDGGGGSDNLISDEGANDSRPGASKRDKVETGAVPHLKVVTHIGHPRNITAEYLTPQDVRNAYGFGPLGGEGVPTGKGQAIAIVTPF